MRHGHSKSLINPTGAAPQSQGSGAPQGGHHGDRIAELTAEIAEIDAAKKARAATGNPTAKITTPTGSAIGRRSRRRKRTAPNLPSKLHEKLATATIVFTEALRADPDFSQIIETDPHGFKGDLLRLVSAQFPLRRGRPTDPLLDDAYNKVEGGMTYTDVLRGQIPNYDALDPYQQYLLAKGLRMAVSRRRTKPRKASRIKARKRTEDEHPPNPPPNQPVN